MYYSCSNIHKAFRRPRLLGVSRAPRCVQRCLHPVMPPCLDTNYRRAGSSPDLACWIHWRYPRKTLRILYSMIAMVVLGQSSQSNPVVLVLQVLSSYFLRKIPSRPKTTRSRTDLPSTGIPRMESRQSTLYNGKVNDQDRGTLCKTKAIIKRARRQICQCVPPGNFLRVETQRIINAVILI